MKNGLPHTRGLAATSGLLGLCLALAAAPAFAKGAGTSTANFLKMGVGGRASAMGEAQTASVNDALSLYWNPAAMGELNMKEVMFMRNNYFQGINQSVFYYIQPTATRGTFGGGLSYLQVSDITGYDTAGFKTSDLTASDALLTFGWGKFWDGLDLFRGLNTGANFKYLRKSLGNDSAGTFMVDLGLLYEAKASFAQGLKTGFTVQNVGPGLEFESESSPLPMLMKLGFAYPLFGDNMTLALDFIDPSDNDLYANAGVEYNLLQDRIAVRLGFNGKNDLDTGLTYGVGFGNERLHLDYAFVPFGKLGDSHRISLGLRFGSAYRRAQVHDQIRDAYEKAEAKFGQGYLVEAYMDASSIVDVAPWHRPSRVLMHKVEKEFKDLEDTARREQLQLQIDNHFARGEKHFQMDELIAAKKEFDAILALQPNHIGAQAYMKRIEERFGSLVQVFYEDGMRFFAAGQYEQAKDQFQKVLVIDPKHVEAQEQLTRTENLLREAASQEKQRVRNEALKPVYHEALLAFEAKNYEKALQHFDDILNNIDREHPESKRYRAICVDILSKSAFEEGNKAAQEGDWARAKKKYDQSLKYKENEPARNALEQVQSQLGEQRKVDSQTYYRRGLEKFLAGDQDGALADWNKAIELDPGNLEAIRGRERLMNKRSGGDEQ